MPDGQLCLLALPPECCQGEGPEAMQYLKLFCRYITDRKVGGCEERFVQSLLCLSASTHIPLPLKMKCILLKYCNKILNIPKPP